MAKIELLRTPAVARRFKVFVDGRPRRGTEESIRGAIFNLWAERVEIESVAVRLLNGALLEVPRIPDLHKRMLAAFEAGGLLEQSDWHTCETTHCRAGWAVHLAGEAGYALELAVGPLDAGWLITMAAQGWRGDLPDFQAPNPKALAAIERCARAEARS